MSFDSTKNCAMSSSFLLLQGMSRGDPPRMMALTAGISTSSRSKAATHGLGICELILFVLFFFSSLLSWTRINRFTGCSPNRQVPRCRYMKACGRDLVSSYPESLFDNFFTLNERREKKSKKKKPPIQEMCLVT